MISAKNKCEDENRHWRRHLHLDNRRSSDMTQLIDLQPSDNILKRYGGSRIENLGVTTLKVTYGNKSVETKFHVFEAPGNPSMTGCKQAQDLEIITVNVNDLTSTPTSRAQQAANNGELSKSIIQQDFKDFFDKIGRFPRDKYQSTFCEPN